ncbi:MAG: NUDIX domain-containing protein [Candidatus Woesearchaeota archaeon]
MSLLIVNNNQEVLLQMRDNIPHILFPNMFSTFGGRIEQGETPQQAILREIEEELALCIQEPELYKVLHYNMHDIHFTDYIFVLYEHLSILKVYEGQYAQYVSKQEIGTLPITPHVYTVLKEFFKEKPKII